MKFQFFQCLGTACSVEGTPEPGWGWFLSPRHHGAALCLSEQRAGRCPCSPDPLWPREPGPVSFCCRSNSAPQPSGAGAPPVLRGNQGSVFPSMPRAASRTGAPVLPFTDMFWRISRFSVVHLLSSLLAGLLIPNSETGWKRRGFRSQTDLVTNSGAVLQMDLEGVCVFLSHSESISATV